MIEHQLSEHLLEEPLIRARIGLRLYAGKAPQNVKGELIILQEVISSPVYTVKLEAGIHDKTVQVDCYAATVRAAESLGELVRQRISGFSGTIGTTDPADMQSCRILSSSAISERPADASDQWIHRYQMDFALFITAPVPMFD